MDNTGKFYTQISLCSGYDGIGLGLASAGIHFRESVYVEVEFFAVRNLADKIEKGRLPAGPIWTNLKTFPFRDFHGCADLLTAGFPCQPFSSAGQRQGDRDPRHLWPYIIKGIKACRPAAVLLENVRGLVSAKLSRDYGEDSKGTPVLLHVLRELERAHYCADWGIFSAEECGAVHRRERVFIMAYDNSSGLGRGRHMLRCFADALGFQGDTGKRDSIRCETEGCRYNAARPGEPQHGWEEPRTV